MAVTITVSEVAAETGANSATAERLLAVSVALVERYGANAPEAIENEAALRISGYLFAQPKASIRSESVGTLEAEYAPSRQSALRHSGAMALLSPFLMRRGGFNRMIALTSPNLSETITKRRATGVVNVYGEFVEGPPEEISIRVVLEPIADERIPLEEGLQRETRWRVYTRERLEALAPNSRGDELEIQGRWHRVVLVSYHPSPRGHHYEAETVLA